MPRALEKATQALQALSRSRSAKHRPSGRAFALADRVDALNPTHWDAVTASASVFLQRDYLRALKQHAPANLEPRYALAYAEGMPRVAMVVQRAAVDWRRLPKKQAVKGLAKLDVPEERMLVCGNLLAPGPGVAFAPGVIATEDDWLAIGEALYRLRRADKLLGESSLVMCKDLPSTDVLARDSMRLLSYRTFETEPDMVLDLDPAWRRFDDYLAAMTSGYRSNVNRLVKQMKAGGAELRLLTPADVNRHCDDIQRLYLHVHDRQALRLATLAPGFLPALADALGERFRCRGAWVEGRLVGFIVSLMGPDGESHGYFVGYEPEANEALPIYLSLLQSTVEDALAFGARRLSLGRTALAPKANMGCRPQPMSCLVRHRVPTMNPLLGAAFRFVEPEQPPERSPFKAKKAEGGTTPS